MMQYQLPKCVPFYRCIEFTIFRKKISVMFAGLYISILFSPKIRYFKKVVFSNNVGCIYAKFPIDLQNSLHLRNAKLGNSLQGKLSHTE